MNSPENIEFLNFLVKRFKIERDKFDRSGVYAYTQRLFAYHSNKIEGSILTEEQTAFLFDNGTLPRSDDCYRAKDVEEMNGHFLMFNRMLDTLDEPLSQELIKQFHYELKSGVFEDRANGYAIGDYKQRPNMIGMYETVRPENVTQEMNLLMDWYNSQEVDISVLAEFHARYESIHPFQDGNGRTGRLILFRECMKNCVVPVVIEDANRNKYLEALKEYREEKSLDKLITLFEKEQQFYFEKCKYFM
ncbi:Fic family protein [Romboutsia ilealis]|jgi:Fic family protein|uniref:Fic family protein n=1 Tax=Romboutsia ilealis TaxID=1115758 RepID=UPI0026F38D3C|nr:Fic family protein [Romboutsia ilealis]